MEVTDSLSSISRNTAFILREVGRNMEVDYQFKLKFDFEKAVKIMSV